MDTIIDTGIEIFRNHKIRLKFSEKTSMNVIKLKDKIFGYKWNTITYFSNVRKI